MSMNKLNLLRNIVTLDFETTGLNFRTAEVIEWGIALYYEKEERWETSNALCKPADSIDPEISAITNITDEMVVNSQPFTDYLRTFDHLSNTFSKGYFIAHNSFYDSRILMNYKNYPNTWICTFRMAKKLYADDPTVTQFKLPYLRYRFKLDVPEKYSHTHRADSDAYVTALLFEFFVNEMENRGILDQSIPYGEQIISWLDAPIIYDRMTFGKHKGKLFTEVPKSYWKWAAENMKSLDENEAEYDPDFAASLLAALDKS